MYNYGKIYELRSGYFEFLKNKCPNVPAYVLKDLILKNTKNNRNSKDDREHFQWMIDFANSHDWKYENINITLETFDPHTRELLTTRIHQMDSDWGGVPHDQQRHQKQQELISSGPSNEPIIGVIVDDGLELVEGWHRTIQSLMKWPDGYKQIAWIGYPK